MDCLTQLLYSGATLTAPATGAVSEVLLEAGAAAGAAFALVLTGAVFRAVNMQKTWETARPALSPHPPAMNWPCWTPCPLMLNGRPIHRMPHPCPCKRRPSHPQRASTGALFPGRPRPYRLLPPRLPAAAPPREERCVRPGRGYCMGAVSHNRPGKQPCPRKRQFPAGGRRPGCRSVRSYFSAELYAPQRCQAVDRPAHVHGTPRQCRNALRG